MRKTRREKPHQVDHTSARTHDVKAGGTWAAGEAVLSMSFAQRTVAHAEEWFSRSELVAVLAGGGRRKR